MLGEFIGPLITEGLTSVQHLIGEFGIFAPKLGVRWGRDFGFFISPGMKFSRLMLKGEAAFGAVLRGGYFHPCLQQFPWLCCV